MRKGRGPDLKKASPYIAVAVVLLIIITAIASSIYLKGRKLGGIEVESLYFGIFGDTCDLTVELEGFDDVDTVEGSLKVSFGEYSLPLTHEGSNVTGVLNETHFLALADQDAARITGEVVALDTSIFDLELDLDVEVDLSFIHTLARSIGVTDVEIISVEEGNMTIRLEIEADLTREVVMDMKNVTGQVVSDSTAHELIVSYLRLDPDGTGGAELMIPTASLLTIFLSGDPITLSSWGFEISING
ncbi:MAG: hypothetical protein KAH57_00170 [Thermoplasmata archaeon]|nr:hypothetical protein [Thermoplasmata archaeon]